MRISEVLLSTPPTFSLPCLDVKGAWRASAAAQEREGAATSAGAGPQRLAQKSQPVKKTKSAWRRERRQR